MQADLTLDALDLKCPLPVLKARKAMKSLEPGKVLKVIANDPKSPADIAAFCQTTGHEMKACQISTAPFEFYIQKTEA